jgi:hypothetical protein
LEGSLPANWRTRYYEIELPAAPKRQGFISWAPADSINGQPVAPRNGWKLDLQQDGEREPIRDTWEEFFFEILRYPPEFGFPLTGWRQAWDGKIVDLNALQPFIDGTRAGPNDTPEAIGLR